MAIYYYNGETGRIEPPDNETLSARVALLETQVSQLADYLGACYKAIEAYGDFLHDLLDNDRRADEHIGRIYQELYELAPEKEIIDTVFDDEEERREAINRYMNHADIDTVYAD